MHYTSNLLLLYDRYFNRVQFYFFVVFSTTRFLVVFKVEADIQSPTALE